MQEMKMRATYRSLIIPAVLSTAILIGFGYVNSVLADGLSGEKIQQLLIGNTLEAKFTRTLGNGQEGSIHAWTFYKDASRRLVKVQIEFEKLNGDLVTRDRSFESKWKVTQDGLLCGTNRKGEERCRKNVRVDGRKIRMDGVDGTENRVYVLHKGNAKDL